MNIQAYSDYPIIISGPCALESEKIALQVAELMRALSEELGFIYIFKGSFDKANRTSVDSYRGPGLKKGSQVLELVKSEVGVYTTTDIHLPEQVQEVATVVDLIQIPAFLCRQTDLLLEAGRSGKPVNIKKGQFMSPDAMRFAVEKVRSVRDSLVFLTERGTFFGYGDLVVDYRGMTEMLSFAPVLFDAGHSVQRPSSGRSTSGGNREYMRPLTRAAAATGIDGLFFETHPQPDEALSDGQNSWPLSRAREIVQDFMESWRPSGGPA
jgi:2-dehydro-3-deoxyphosphooctonate aldolase (KDO 8-P synthase)